MHARSHVVFWILDLAKHRYLIDIGGWKSRLCREKSLDSSVSHLTKRRSREGTVHREVGDFRNEPQHGTIIPDSLDRSIMPHYATVSLGTRLATGLASSSSAINPGLSDVPVRACCTSAHALALYERVRGTRTAISASTKRSLVQSRKLSGQELTRSISQFGGM